jgi:hypothetical protein
MSGGVAAPSVWLGQLVNGGGGTSSIGNNSMSKQSTLLASRAQESCVRLSSDVGGEVQLDWKEMDLTGDMDSITMIEDVGAAES